MRGLLVLLISVGLALAIPHKQGRIIGGKTAYVGEYPSSAAIYIQTPEGTYFCGGALIGQEWILTAAQCVDGAISFTIQLGSILLKGDDPSRIILAASEYYMHPDYDPLTLVNDIALIKLRMPVTYTSYLTNIYLAYGNLTDYTNLMAIGWGQTSDSDSSFSNNLMKVNVAAVPNQECKAIYGDQIDDNMVCVAGEYNEGTCHGDVGSPLIHMDIRTRTQRHVGIASFISGNGCETVDPSGFIRTYSYKDWITEISGI